MSHSKLPISAAVLFGPRSRSFGFPKAFLTWGSGSLAAHLVQRAQQQFREVVAVAKEVDWIPRDVHGSVPLFLDHWSENGPQAGLATAIPLVCFNPVFLVSCHQPLFRAEVVRGLWKIWESEGPADVIAPWVGGKWFPFCALWSKTALPFLGPGKWRGLEEALEKGDLKVRRVLEKEVRSWDPGLVSFRELNGIQDWMEIGVLQD